MEITDIRIRKAAENDKVKANVSVTFDDCFAVHDIKIMKGRDGFVIAMPNRKIATGEYKDVVHPINTEFRSIIQKKILEKYDSENKADDISVGY
jgi:stage V sporulation protein G